MSLVSTQQHPFTTTTTTTKSTSLPTPNHHEDVDNRDTEATLSTLLGAFTNPEKNSMERGAPEFPQSGLHSPFSSAFNEPQSEDTPADHASAAQFTPQQEVRANPQTYSTSATPTSEYGVYPASARSASFPEHIQRQYPPNNQAGSSGAMAQSTSPSLPLQDGRANHQNAQIKSDSDVPIDPSIAASSPTYPPNGGQYSPYPPQQEMHHGYPQHPGAMYAQPRPDWAGYGGHPQHVPAGYAVSGAQTPTSAAPAGARPGQHPLSQVYSFVPIPGAQQHKRPRRRYEEIERMYKCGWNGCEKAYGTLNHLNAHVTMQSHGTKRTPEEFKEIRKEWKARKKEEESQRKAEEDRARTAIAAPDGQQAEGAPPTRYQGAQAQVQLPPISYQPGSQVPGQYQAAPAGGVQQLQEYSQSHSQMYSGYPTSPYGNQPQMYSQHNGGQAPQPKYEH